MSKVITVFGASGQLGCAVVKGLSRDFNVRAVTDPSSPTLDNLCSLEPNINIVNADLGSCSSLEDALDGASGCFIITNTDFNSADGYEKEVREGQAIADACARAGIERVIYSTQLSVVKTLGVNARHFDAKHVVEAYMKTKGLPLTSLIVPCLYESLLLPSLRPKRLETDSYDITIPMGSTPLCMMSVDDVGEVVRQLFLQGKTYLHKTISVCGDKITTREIVSVLNRALSPKCIQDKQVTIQEYGNQGFPGARDLAHMFEFYCRVDQKHSIDLTNQLNPNTQNFDQWVRNNLARVAEALDLPLTQCPDPWASV